MEPFEALAELARDIVRLRTPGPDLGDRVRRHGSVFLLGDFSRWRAACPAGIIPMGTATKPRPPPHTGQSDGSLSVRPGRVVEGNTRRVMSARVNGHAFLQRGEHRAQHRGYTGKLEYPASSAGLGRSAMRVAGRPSAHQRVGLRGPDHRKGRDHSEGSRFSDRRRAMAATYGGTPTSSSHTAAIDDGYLDPLHYSPRK